MFFYLLRDPSTHTRTYIHDFSEEKLQLYKDRGYEFIEEDEEGNERYIDISEIDSSKVNKNESGTINLATSEFVSERFDAIFESLEALEPVFESEVAKDIFDDDKRTKFSSAMSKIKKFKQ